MKFVSTMGLVILLPIFNICVTFEKFFPFRNVVIMFMSDGNRDTSHRFTRSHIYIMLPIARGELPLACGYVSIVRVTVSEIDLSYEVYDQRSRSSRGVDDGKVSLTTLFVYNV